MKEKFFYIANMRMPTEKAHGIQIMEMCQAFANLGHEVELIVPDRNSEIKDDPFKFYDMKPSFKITRLWCLDVVKWGRVGFWIETLTFALSSVLYLRPKKGIFYTRDEALAVALQFSGKNIPWEAHMGQKNFLVRKLIKAKTKIVVITEGLKEVYESLGVPSKDILVAADGADVSRFDIPLSREDARTQLDLPQDKKIILYKGSLGIWKGAGTLAESAKFAKTDNLQFVFIGGTPEDVEAFKKNFAEIPNVSILGNRPRKETPVYQKAADLLVIPNSAKEDISKLYTSPMKLFGYMAGGVPIVTSDLPSIREVLTEEYAFFFTPDDAQSLAQSIDHVFTNYEEAKRKAKASLMKVREYSWERRAESILAFIKA